jgi:hypothetical protein
MAWLDDANRDRAPASAAGGLAGITSCPEWSGTLLHAMLDLREAFGRRDPRARIKVIVPIALATASTDRLDRPGRPLLRAAMPYQPKGRDRCYVNGLHGDPGATRWPPEIARMMRRVYKLDGLVAKYEVSEPEKAHSYRLRASALLVQVEVGKRLQLASEISEGRRAQPHIQQ